MKRLMEKIVLEGFVTACRLAAWPTTRSPLLVNATTEGVVRAPSEFSTTTGSPPSMTAMQEFVVPKSMPKILAIKTVTPFVETWPRARGVPGGTKIRMLLIVNQLRTKSIIIKTRQRGANRDITGQYGTSPGLP